jgi:DP-EP family
MTNDKSLKINPLHLEVPLGGQIIRNFELTPALPNPDAQQWQLDEIGYENVKGITETIVTFAQNEKQIERDLERAVLIVNMKQNPDNDGVWRFALNGAATSDKTKDEDTNHDIALEIINDGLTLMAFVHVYRPSEERIKFGYVASYTHHKSGKVDIFESSDPGFVPIRPE